MPKISVIIPVYNAEKYLAQCLESVINQTLNDIEIICVDDGSTDGSISILEKYASNDSRIFITYGMHQGAGKARNIGLYKAKGQYIFFMDADDYCDRSLLEKTVNRADSMNADIVVFGFFKVDNRTGKKTVSNGMNLGYLNNTYEFSYKDVPNKICSLVNPTPWNKVFKKDFLIREKLEYLTLSTTNDITFATLAGLYAKKITYLHEYLYYYRVGINSNITNRKRKNLHNVTVATLEVDKCAKRLEYYNAIKNSIRVFIVKNLFIALERYAGKSDTAYYVDFSKEVDAVLYGYDLFRDIRQEDIDDKYLYTQIVNCQKKALHRNDRRYFTQIVSGIESIKLKNINGCSPKVMVSLTSFPFRIRTVHKVIASIFLQSRVPDKIILWLAESQFPNKEKDLPTELLEYVSFGLEIKWVNDDLKSHKKYFYAIKEYPENIIITIDDDLIYYPDMIEKLLKSYILFPNAISTMRTHFINFNGDNCIQPYCKWDKEYSGIVGKASMRLFSTTGAGTLFPPGCIDAKLLDKELIKKMVLNADDIWLKVLEVLLNIPVVLVEKNRELQYIDGTQEVALQYDNVFNNQNDMQLKKILDWAQSKYGLKEGWFVKAVNDTLPCYFDIDSSTVYKKSDNYQVKKSAKNIIIGGIACYQEHGLKYTLKRIIHKLKNRLMK